MKTNTLKSKLAGLPVESVSTRNLDSGRIFSRVTFSTRGNHADAIKSRLAEAGAVKIDRDFANVFTCFFNW